MQTNSQREAYLAAMFDGEGTVAKAPEKVAVIYSSDPHLIVASAWCAVHLGVKDMTVRIDHRGDYKPQYSLSFYKKRTFEILYRLPMQALNKSERLRAILLSYKGRQKKEWDRERALRLHKEGMSPWRIAHRVGVDYTTVQNYLRSLGEEHVHG